MNVSTRARAKTADSVAKESRQQQQRRESSASQPQSNPQSDATVDMSEHNGDENSNIKEDVERPSVASATTAVAPDTPTNNNDDDDDDEPSFINIPAQNIRQFKEAVVNTSRLLKVFGDQEKELAKSKAEIARCNDEIKRLGTVYQGLQRDLDNRSRELTKANAETENAKSLLVLREEELSRVRGLKEDLETQVSDLRQAQSGAEQIKSASAAAAASSLSSGVVASAQPVKSPNAPLLEEIERLKSELEAKEGTIKSLRISRDGIRSSTRAEVISIQARYAREQAELIERQEREMAQHRQSLAGKEAELEQEQDRLMQLEMDLNIRSTQLEDQAAELKTSLEAMTDKYEASQKDLKALEDAQKSRTAESRTEIARLGRAAKKDEKRIADLEAALERAKTQAKENARQKTKPRPKSTATAAEAVSAATEDVAEMSLEELREEVAGLRVDAVHKDETIRKLGVMVEELERKQNPEGRKPRGRVAVLQAELDELRAELELREKKIDALETALKFSQDGASDSEKPADPAAAIAQLDLKIISLEALLREKDEKVAGLERELTEAKEAVNERPMRLRHATGAASTLSPTRSTTSRLSSPASAGTKAAGSSGILPQQRAQPQADKAAGLLRGDRSSVAAAQGRSGRMASQAGRLGRVLDQGQGDESLYIEVATLRAKVEKMQQERAALQELVTEQQVKIRQLRNGGVMAAGEGTGGALARSKQQQAELIQSPTPVQTQPRTTAFMDTAKAATAVRKKRDLLPLVTLDEIEQEGVVASKRQKQSAASGQGGKRAVSRSHSAVSVGGPDAQQGEAAGKQTSGSDEPDINSMERLLRNRRIGSVNRTKRFFLLLQKSPQLFNQKLLEIPWSIEELDKTEAQQLLMALVATNAAQPGSDIRLVASQDSITVPSEHGKKLAGLYPSEAEISASIWTLCFKYSRGEFFGGLMKLLAQSIVSPPSGFSVVATCSLTRVFAALGVLSGDIQRVRVMLCDLLMEAVDSAHTLPVLSNALSVWPAALSEPSEGKDSEAGARASLRLVVRVVQAIAAGIHDLYSEERSKEEADALYQVMVDQCGWRMPRDAEFADRILVEVNDTLRGLDSSSSDYAVVLCAFNLLSPYVSEAASAIS
ncbi:hypothetical protein H4R99_005391 [Coemansia sp. RSA 1722]|nr:hypothetical protein H4R99_005391 [Coemansia sp. RSA 1722]